MATYENPSEFSVAARYPSLGGYPRGGNDDIKTLDDGKGTETTFEIGEKLTATTSFGMKFDVYFRGTYEHEGKTLLVVSVGSGPFPDRYYIVGLEDTGPNPLVPSTHIDSSGSFTVCFLSGTSIATPTGERKVEELRPGDPVLVEENSSVRATWTGRLGRNIRQYFRMRRAVTVKFIGRQTVSTIFGPAERLMPVRFATGSLGGGGGGSRFCRIAT